MDFQSIAASAQGATDTRLNDSAADALPSSLPDSAQNDPDLTAVVAAWPTLRPERRAAVLAMIRASATPTP